MSLLPIVCTHLLNPPGQAAGERDIIIWARQLQKEGEDLKPIGNAFQIKSVLKNIDDLKKAIKKEKPNRIVCDADELDIYRLQDGKWEKEDEDAEVRRDTTRKDFYGYALP